MDTAEWIRSRRYRPGTNVGMPRRAVAFDIDHTLVVDNKIERIAFLRLLLRVDREGGHALGTLDEESVAIDALLDRQRNGAFSIDEAVRLFARDRGVTTPGPFVDDFRSIALSLVDEIVVPVPGMPRLLASLRERGITTAILTNGWSPLQQHKALRAGFDGPVLVSADIGVSKPQPAAFAALVERLSLPASSIWYVGESPVTDVVGALEAGLRAVWYNAEGRRYPTDLPPPDAEIRDLQDVESLLASKIS